MSRLTEFYKGTGTDSEGRTIAMIWAYSHNQWEATHDFIQWLFPLPEPSRFNPSAPVLSEKQAPCKGQITVSPSNSPSDKRAHS